MCDPKTVVEPARWLGETSGFWIQTLILAVSALAAVLIIRSSAKQERRRATIDLVLEQRNSPEYTTARLRVHRMHDSGEKNLARYLQSPESAEYRAIMELLNSYEFAAAGIRESAFDEETLKRMRHSTLLKDWDAFNGFVMEFRRTRDRKTLFQDFEWLHKRWVEKPLKPDNK